jgi:ATP-dependent DNA ligase
MIVSEAISPLNCHDDPTIQHGAWFLSGRHACKMGLEGIVSKRLGSRYRSGRTSDWLKFKNPEAPAVIREAEEEWGRRGRWR